MKTVKTIWKAINWMLAMFIMGVSSLRSQDFEFRKDDVSLHIYPYVFQESTGDNQFILYDGKLVPVRSFSKDSEQQSLKAFQALKSNILYPNSGGTKIFLFGKYDPESAGFFLKAWFIQAPFESHDIIDEKSLPHEFSIIRRDRLLQSDFKIEIPNLDSFVHTPESINSILRKQVSGVGPDSPGSVPTNKH